MSPWLSLFLLTHALLDQAQRVQPPKLPARPNPVEMMRNVLKAQPKVCAIPLINALKPNAPVPDAKMAIPVAPKEQLRASMKYVTPPAPPCDDWK